MIHSSDYQVLLDACVLVPPTVCDLLLRLAETPRLYRPRWTAEILEEASRNLVKAGVSPQRAGTWRPTLEREFPEAMVRDYERLIDDCGNHERDRHVLAAAARCQAGTILTFNLKHFPAEALDRWSISATHPADYLTTMLELDEKLVARRIAEMARDRGLAWSEIMERLRRNLPTFAAILDTN